VKFGFSVQTRDGQRVDGITIMGQDQDDAERKLRQMYRQCSILRCEVLADDRQKAAASVEDLLSLISKEY